MAPTVRSISLLAALALVGAAGCDGLNARRAVREGNDQFQAGRYDEAVSEFKKAIELEPGLAIAHHNLALTFFKLFGGTSDDAKRKEYGDLAAVHFGEYLKAFPKDSVIRNKMTTVWMDSGNEDKAIAFWEDQLKAEPDNQQIMAMLAGITLRAGNWKGSLGWLTKSLEVSKTDENKRSLHVQIGRRCREIIINRTKITGQERIDVSDVCVPLVLAGTQADPKNTELLAVLNQIFSIRALSQGASFAATIDKASGQDHDQLRRVLNEEAKKAKAAAEGLPYPPPATGSAGSAAPAPSAPAAGSGSGALAVPPSPPGSGSASGSGGTAEAGQAQPTAPGRP